MRKAIIFVLFLAVFLFGSKERFFLGRVYPSSVPSLYSSYLKGVLAEKYGDYQRALLEYISAGSLDRDSVSVNLRKAVQYIKLERFNQAEEVLTRIKEADPLNLDVGLLLVFLYGRQGEEDKAIQEYGDMLSRMHKKSPENVNITGNLARYKVETKDYDGALKLYQEIINLEPGNSDVYFWVGYIYEETGKRNEAIQTWEKTLELKPDHVDALNSLGYIYAEEGVNLDRAEELVKRALEIRPGLAAYLDSLGWVYFKKGNFQKAKKYIEKAADKLEDPVILEHLGQIYYELGQLKDAEAVWRKILQIKPDLEKIRKRLENIDYEISTKQD